MPVDPRVRALREELAAAIVRSLGESGQHDIGPWYGIPQPRLSELNRGMVDRCSTEWLIRCIHRLGGSVRVTVELHDVRTAWLRERFAEMRERRLRRTSG